jgi:hypothetical protein
MKLSRREFLQSSSALGIGSGFTRDGTLGSRPSQSVQGRTFHVAPDGDDGNPGTKKRPFRSLKPLATNHDGDVQNGDTVYLHGGTHNWSERASFYEIHDLTITAAADERPTIDASEIDGDANSNGALQFFQCNHCLVNGIEFTEAPGPGIDFDKSKNPVVEGCVIHHCGGAGIQLTKCAGGAIRGCEVFAGFGPKPGNGGSVVGGDADGLQVTGSSDSPGVDTILEYNIAHHNSDDGFDFYHAKNLVIRYNVAYANGFGLDGEPAGKAPGKGIKLGASGVSGDGGHRVHNNAAWSNGHAGIGWNGADVPVDCYNNTCVGNGRKADLKENIHENDFAFYGASSSCKVYNNIGHSVRPSSNIDSIDSENVKKNSWQLDLPATRKLFSNADRNATGVPVDPVSFLKVPPTSPAMNVGLDLDPREYPGSHQTLGASTTLLPYLGSQSQFFPGSVTTPESTATATPATTPTNGTTPTPGRITAGPDTPGGPSGTGVPIAPVSSLLAAGGIAILGYEAIRRRLWDEEGEDDRENLE